MNAVPRLETARARALFLDSHGLADPPSGPGKGADLAGLIGDLGFVQLDSINIVARAHHMILHARRSAYRARHLHLLHDRDRGVFEHWTHDASMIDMRHFPHWRLRFRRNEVKSADLLTRRGPDFARTLDDILRHIGDHGPCCSADVGRDEPKSPGGWWEWHPSKVALEYLWRIGVLSVTRRDSFRKVYDLTENVIPPEYLNAQHSEAETIHWACSSALDRLSFATSGELAAFWALITPDEAKRWCAEALSRGDVVEAEITQTDGRLRKVLMRPETLDKPVPTPPGRIRILSPFDPVLRDRNRAERLFGFHYRIEIFVPEAKRRYGYYVFPILEGDRVIGRVDMKAERDADRLHVKALWPEAGVAMGRSRRARLEAALERSARLANVSRVSFATDWLRSSG